jgi:hypothetical protein
VLDKANLPSLALVDGTGEAICDSLFREVGNTLYA